MIGHTISHYKILEKLGEGGMGVVYKAYDTTLDRTVALKFLPQYLTSDPVEKERFYHEAKAAASLTHSNVAVVHEIGEHDGQIFIVMECVEGKTLRQIILSGELSLKQALDLAVQVADGLAAAHEKGIVHRDVKPENIIITPKRQAKITDFGLAKLKGATKLTKVGSTLGTAAYMSPEQARGEEVDQRSDIFSFGVVLYEMLAGKLPFRGEHAAALMYSIANEELAPLARFNEQVTPDLQHIVSKALAKEVDERYQHVDDVLADLRRERKILEYAKSGYIKATEKATPVPKRRLGKMAVIAAAIVVMIVLGVIFNPFKSSNHQSSVAASTENKSIAVLPFVDMSPQKDQDYLCDGMTEALIDRLSNLHGLNVPASTSAFMFKGLAIGDLKDVGTKLHVQTVLEGHVQKSGERLRITVELIDIADGYHLWSRKYDRDLKDVFAIQDEISGEVVEALQLKLTAPERQRLSEHPINNIDAYNCYLKALRQVRRFDEKSLDSALTFLQTALDIIGDNAELYAGLAYVYEQYANIGIHQEEYFDRSEKCALKALALNANMPSALIRMGSLSTYKSYPQNLRGAIEYGKKALLIDPKLPEALSGLAFWYAVTGDSAQACAFAERFAIRDPLSPQRFTRWGYCYLFDCQFTLALEQFRANYGADSTNPLAITEYSRVLLSNNKMDEVSAVLSKVDTGNSKNVLTTLNLMLKYALLKEKGHSLRLMTTGFQKTCRRDFQWSYYLATTLSLLGCTNEALDWLGNAIQCGFINYPFLQCDPLLDNIRREERFKKLMEKARYEWEHFRVPQ